LNAAEPDAVADIDAGRTHIDALMAIDAVAGRLTGEARLLGLLDRGAGLAAVTPVRLFLLHRTMATGGLPDCASESTGPNATDIERKKGRS
jgi:hypothetical protein